MSLRASSRAATLAGLLTLSALPTHAGPDETTSRLMNEYASLLDFGILRLQLRLDKLTTIPPSAVSYVWDDNVILISSFSVDSEWPRDRVEQACTDFFFDVRANAGIDQDTGKVFGVLDSTFFADLFNHYGYSNTIAGKSTDEFAIALDQKFQLRFTWFSYSSVPGTVRSIECSGPLLDKGYSVKVENVEDQASSP